MNNKYTRFLYGGLANTILSYTIYCILLSIFNFNISYILSVIFAILFSYKVNTNFVFKVKCGRATSFLFVMTYALQVILGIFLLNFLVEELEVAKLIAPLINIIVITPIIFIISNILTNSIKTKANRSIE